MQREEGEMPSLPLLLPRIEVRQRREQDEAEPHSGRKKTAGKRRRRKKVYMVHTDHLCRRRE